MPELRTYPQAHVEIVGRRPEEEQDPDRLWAARRVAFLSRLLHERGWKEYRWTPGKPGPIPRVKEYGSWDWDFIQLPSGHLRRFSISWFDHPYRLVNKESGRELFRVEPYDFDIGFYGKDLTWIEERGWNVSIDADTALHFPGKTVCIEFEKAR